MPPAELPDCGVDRVPRAFGRVLDQPFHGLGGVLVPIEFRAQAIEQCDALGRRHPRQQLCDRSVQHVDACVDFGRVHPNLPIRFDRETARGVVVRP